MFLIRTDTNKVQKKFEFEIPIQINSNKKMLVFSAAKYDKIKLKHDWIPEAKSDKSQIEKWFKSINQVWKNQSEKLKISSIHDWSNKLKTFLNWSSSVW